MFRRDCESSPSASVSTSAADRHRQRASETTTTQRTYHLAQQRLEHRNDAANLRRQCSSSQSAKVHRRGVRIDRLLNQDRISRVYECMYSLDTPIRVNQTETASDGRPPPPEQQARG